MFEVLLTLGLPCGRGGRRSSSCGGVRTGRSGVSSGDGGVLASGVKHAAPAVLLSPQGPEHEQQEHCSDPEPDDLGWGVCQGVDLRSTRAG